MIMDFISSFARNPYTVGYREEKAFSSHMHACRGEQTTKASFPKLNAGPCKFFFPSKTKLVETLKCKLICMYKGSLICSACYACDKQRLHTFVTQLDGKYLSEEKK